MGSNWKCEICPSQTSRCSIADTCAFPQCSGMVIPNGIVACRRCMFQCLLHLSVAFDGKRLGHPAKGTICIAGWEPTHRYGFWLPDKMLIWKWGKWRSRPHFRNFPHNLWGKWGKRVLPVIIENVLFQRMAVLCFWHFENEGNEGSPSFSFWLDRSSTSLLVWFLAQVLPGHRSHLSHYTDPSPFILPALPPNIVCA